MKPVVFHPEAEEEISAASGYYESRVVGLGQRFLLCVQRGVDIIAETPRRPPVLAGEIRRILLRPFPYGLLFREFPEKIVVLAVMHLHREPGYWKARQSDP